MSYLLTALHTPRSRASGEHTRSLILQELTRRPGLSHTELVHSLHRGWGNLQYHLRTLTRMGRIHATSLGRQTRFFALQAEPLAMQRIAILRRGRTRDVVEKILQQPGLVQRRLSEQTLVTRKILRSYIDLLLGAGLVEERRTNTVARYFPTSELARLVQEMGEVEANPSPASTADPPQA